MMFKRGCWLMTAALVAVALTGTTALAASPAQPPAAYQERSELQSDLMWLFTGLQKLDREPQLKVSRKQASQILAVLKPLVNQGIVAPGLAKRRTGPAAGPGGASGTGPGGGAGFRNLTPQQRAEFRKRAQEREKQLQSAMDRIDRILSAKQGEFIDNLDFDSSPYLFSRSAAVRGSGQGIGQVGGSSGGGAMLSTGQRDELMAEARKAQARVNDLVRKTLQFLEARAAGRS